MMKRLILYNLNLKFYSDKELIKSDKELIKLITVSDGLRCARTTNAKTAASTHRDSSNERDDGPAFLPVIIIERGVSEVKTGKVMLIYYLLPCPKMQFSFSAHIDKVQ